MCCRLRVPLRGPRALVYKIGVGLCKSNCREALQKFPVMIEDCVANHGPFALKQSFEKIYIYIWGKHVQAPDPYRTGQHQKLVRLG